LNYLSVKLNFDSIFIKFVEKSASARLFIREETFGTNRTKFCIKKRKQYSENNRNETIKFYRAEIEKQK